jgi:hypothetical protein
MTNNPTKYEQILSYGSWQTILPNMNKFCHTVSEELPSQIIKEGQMDVDYRITMSLHHAALGDKKHYKYISY